MAFTTRIITTGALLIASLGASAQQEAVQAMQPGNATPAAASDQVQSPDVAALAQAINAYNADSTTGAVARDTTDKADIANPAVSPATQNLARAVRAYNGELPRAGDTVDYSHSPDQQALALGREVTQFNRSGGSLDVVGQETRTLQ